MLVDRRSHDHALAQTADQPARKHGRREPGIEVFDREDAAADLSVFT